MSAVKFTCATALRAPASRLSDGLVELVHHRVGHRLHVVRARHVLGHLGPQLFSGVCLGLPTAGVTGILSAVLERHKVPLVGRGGRVDCQIEMY